MIDLFNGLISDFGTVLTAILALLPTSPFQWAVGALGPYLGWLNFFLPFNAIVAEIPVWLTAVALWYAYRIVLRWIKVAGD